MRILTRSLFFMFAAATSLPIAVSQTLGPDFINFYTVDNLANVPGVPSPYGGMLFKDGDPNVLLIIGAAGKATSNIYEVGVARDAQGHVTGFVGAATFLAMTPEGDGGLIYAPNGVLLYTTYPTNMLGQIKPGSTSADKLVDLSSLGVGSSTGGIAITPSGFPGAGSLKITSYGTDSWYDADLVPDGSGTYDVTNVAHKVYFPSAPGPESIEFVEPTSQGFNVQSVLIAQWYNEKVSAYDLDASGDPIPSTRRDFLECCTIFFMGSTTDPVTGDWLFGDWGSGDQVMVIKKNQVPLGTNYCGPANSNSTGQSAVIFAFGNPAAALNDLTLYADLLPLNVFGYFLNSDKQGFVPFPPGSSGNLCLGGGIGRHIKQIGNSGSAGRLDITVDLTVLPRPNGTHSVVAGETWNFQCWYRDKVGGTPTSNFTDGLSILFQ